MGQPGAEGGGTRGELRKRLGQELPPLAVEIGEECLKGNSERLDAVGQQRVCCRRHVDA